MLSDAWHRDVGQHHIQLHGVLRVLVLSANSAPCFVPRIWPACHSACAWLRVLLLHAYCICYTTACVHIRTTQQHYGLCSQLCMLCTGPVQRLSASPPHSDQHSMGSGLADQFERIPICHASLATPQHAKHCITQGCGAAPCCLRGRDQPGSRARHALCAAVHQQCSLCQNHGRCGLGHPPWTPPGEPSRCC